MEDIKITKLINWLLSMDWFTSIEDKLFNILLQRNRENIDDSTKKNY